MRAKHRCSRVAEDVSTSMSARGERVTEGDGAYHRGTTSLEVDGDENIVESEEANGMFSPVVSGAKTSDQSWGLVVG